MNISNELNGFFAFCDKILNQPDRGANMTKNPIFIGGEGRSGTTLLRIVLDTHPNISCGPETHFFIDNNVKVLCKYLSETYKPRIMEYNSYPDDQPYLTMARSFGAILDSFHSNYMMKRGKLRWADKTPHNILNIQFISDAFPDMKFIHIIRNGLDVAASMFEMPWGTTNVNYIANSWASCIKAGKEYAANHDNYLEIRYEDLILSSKSTITKVVEFLDEPWDDKLLQYNTVEHDYGIQYANESSAIQVQQAIYNSKINRWKSDLTIEQVNEFMAVSGNLYEQMGYEL